VFTTIVVQHAQCHTLIRIDKDLSIPVYLQIANGLVNIIKQGALRPGAALPSSRKLAGMLTIHRKTVIAAYDELLAQNWVEAIPVRDYS